ncbi:DUF58 domain-containing protein [Oceanihabitans sediminis]|uniref:DUF58 domain-containing protein n=1 Tax=Oceanihabitans sediminis TaxID=1812012 RepID=A0A368P740_9FLAO|nr:DUF58 domain-containing protein [Oceanihabitans sediminis]MDX1278408.1 DUF58 domain-containing protein [Oceanihabitans sediminis]MDX1773993.1 DUF58 domain-containing protein [Oceanihabitans sediminis]RBP31980.1 uncharacterized protein DUF58 [Oceanihabitans sediminis]RCU58642.1 DUF58 domain-containing protein [Oceanihabitans sediminis]
MNLRDELHKAGGFKNLELLAKQVVEGFISGMHKSPFHGFSAEFAEHKIYNQGESTRHIDWKLFAKTDKLYTKRYDDETNLRCHIIIDNSSSMHYPQMQNFSINNLNKIAFSALAAASLMHMLKKQRDAVGLSIYSDAYDFYAPEKGSERHHQMLLHQLSETVVTKQLNKKTETYNYLHLIAEKIHRRSLIFLFTDMLQTGEDETKLFEALRHLKHNKHEVVLFHVFDKKKELSFDFDNKPKRFVDVETGEHINLYSESIKDNYEAAISSYFQELRLKCGQYRIKYVESDINLNFDNILTTYMIERQRFL